jgi:hypothetical protein
MRFEAVTTPRHLAARLDKSFIAGVSWPIDQASLAALLDMGLSPRQIAHYFLVTPGEMIQVTNATGAANTKLPDRSGR